MNERWIKVWGILLVFGMNVTSGWMFENGSRSQIFLRVTTVLLFMILQWEAAHQIIRYGRRKFPQLERVRKRVVFTAVQFFALSVVLQCLNDVAINNGIDKAPFVVEPLRLASVVLSGLLFTLTTIGMFEAVYYYNNFSRAEVEKEELLRANLQSQLDSLKSQVNPHFLFNSLNSLTSLIAKDPVKAECFVEEMSNVYRYLLRSNEQELVTLDEELAFIDSYLHLLKTRFGNNLAVTKNVAERHRCFLLPPLTLQLLIENTVKHNVVSSDAPLRIVLSTTTNDRLEVTNNLQKKHREVVSGKVGLSNIVAKYKLLRQPEIDIWETQTEFTVRIPLIKSPVHERVHH